MRMPSRLGLAGLLVMGLSACDPAALLPEDRPAPAAKRPSAEAVRDPSPESVALERYYARVEAGLLSRGLLRTDGGGPDVPFSAEDLVRNFEQIALFEEYANVGGRLVARQTESRLHRWSRPVLFGVTFGPAYADERAEQDRQSIEAYVARLSEITGLPMSVTESARANFHIFIVGEDERRALGPRLLELVPGLGPAALDTVIDLPRSSYCLVFAADRDDSNDYDTAVAVIRAEHPDILRLSCIHEEIAQGLGLSNDSPRARPSVFNDDEEFGLLTYHDELLLQMLYDPRLEPGMTADEAMPIVRVIAKELLDDRDS